MDTTFQATDDEDELRRPLVLITGSSGLIGRRAVDEFARDFRVVGLDLTHPERLPAHASFIECDLTDAGAVATALAHLAERHGRRIASVIHLAAHYDFSGEPSPLYRELTVEGTRRLLHGLRRFEVEQFVFASTILVMRQAEPGELIDEDSPVEAEWDYPASKLEAEAVIAEERGAIPAVILRIAGVYDGQGHSPPITQQIHRIYSRTLESHLFPGNDDRGQPFVHLDDAIAALRRTVERRRTLGEYEVLLIAEPELLTYAELQDRLGQLIHGEDHWTTLKIPAPLAKAGAWLKDKFRSRESFIKPWMVDLADTHLPISTRRAQQRLDWHAQHRLSTTLPAMVEHLLQNPGQFYRENKLAA
jgi:nucleoside-diphosphate-sugar epimerase